MNADGTPVSVASIHVHPVKSCRGTAVASAALDHWGIVGDRRFLVVDPSGSFLTQRTVPRLALVRPTFDPGSRTLELSAPSGTSVRVATQHSDATSTATIWGNEVRVVDVGAEAARWLTDFLERPVRLVHMASDFTRPVSRAARAGDETAFTDGFPLLVIGEASLADLSHRLDFPVPMDRFRPNLVLRGSPPYAEDTWKRIRIGDCILRAAGPCARCVVTTTDQETLERSPEPLRTLARYRRSEEGAVLFGQNYIHETKSGTLRVGAEIEILEA
jgi:uncharacterized protein YcbX